MATYMKALEQKNQNVKGQKALQGREDILSVFFFPDWNGCQTHNSFLGKGKTCQDA